MADPLNLRTARKRAKRLAEDRRAQANRLAHGRSKAAKRLAAAREAKAISDLERHRVEIGDGR
jgi:hypothetical protein